MNRSCGFHLLFSLMLCGLSLPAFTGSVDVKAGGIVLTLPGPSKDFDEVGDRLRTTVFDLLAPSTNRLLSAYLPVQKLADLTTGKPSGGLEFYGLIEVPRQAEYVDCPPEAFQEALKNFDSSKFDASTAAEEMNARLKAIGQKTVEMGQPEILGSIFRKTDAAGIAMLAPFKQGDKSTTMAAGIALLRVRQRVVFAYLFRKYESPDTVAALRTQLEAWSDAILLSNK